jgi:hypothetical protein
MNKLEYIESLIAQGANSNEVFEKARQYDIDNPVETEVVEETVEEIEEGNSNDSPPTGADVDQTVVAPETEVTESQSEDGSVESQEKINPADVVIDAPVGSEERKQQYIAKGWALDETTPGYEKEQELIENFEPDYSTYDSADGYYPNEYDGTTTTLSEAELEEYNIDKSKAKLDDSYDGYIVKKSDFYGSEGMQKRVKELDQSFKDYMPKAEDVTAAAPGIMFGELVGKREMQEGGGKLKKLKYQQLGFDTHDDYLKSELGDKYADYVTYEQNPEKFPFPTSVLDQAEVEVKTKDIQNILRDLNDKDLQNAYKPFAEAQLKNEKIKIETQNAYLIGVEKQIKANNEETVRLNKVFEEKASPLIETMNSSVNSIKEKFGEEAVELGLSDEDRKDPKKVDEFNAFVDTFQAASDAYQKGEFVNIYNTLIENQSENELLLTNYEKGRENFDGDDLQKAEAIAKAMGMDYSITARAGAALEDFFIGGALNVGSLTAQGGLHIIKALVTDPGAKEMVDSAIDTLSQKTTNYNTRIGEHREATIPPPLNWDDFSGAGGVFRYIGESLADNSPSIITTFLPLGASLMGMKGIANAAKGIGKLSMKQALQANKKYGLYAMRASQSIFFAGESGGKYGEIQVAEGKARNFLTAKDKITGLTKQESYNKMVVGENGVTQEDKNNLADEIAENIRLSSYTYTMKAFTSYGFGGTAALAETFGSLKFVKGTGKLASMYGKTVAKKAMYESASKYRIQLAKTYIKGMAPLITKAAPTEIMEEGLTQISHNAIDILVLGEDKSFFEGINKDFLIKTAITSFAIGGPTTMQGTVNLLKNEVRTKAEVDANKGLTNELLTIEANAENNNRDLTKIEKQRKAEIVEELAFDDGINYQKLNHLSGEQIEEVGEINRLIRAYKKQAAGLGNTGDLSSKDSKKADKNIKDKVAKLEAKKDSILGAKNRTVAQQAKDIKKKLGASESAIDEAKYFGYFDFANDAAMILSAKGKKFINLEGAGEYTTDDAGNKTFEISATKIEKALKDAGYSDEVIKRERLIEKLSGNKPSNGLQINGDIIINSDAVKNRIANSLDSNDAKYAAVSPLEELFHADLRDKKIVDKNGKLGKDTTAAINEAMEAIETAKELGNLNEEDYNGLMERFKLYQDKDGSYDMEEIMAQINNAMILGAINKSDFTNMNSTKAMLNGMVGKVLGENSWMLNIKTSSDMFNMLDKFQERVADKDAAQGLGDDDETQETEALGKSKKPEEDSKESKGSAISADQTLINETTLEQLKDPNISESQRNRLTKVIVENNSGLFLGGGQYGVNFDANFKDFKNKSGDIITRQEVLNEVSTKLPNIINAYDVKGKGNFGTYAGASLKFKIPEIREAIIGAKDKAKRKQTSIDDSTLEIADEQGQDFDTRETQKDTSRKKVYPSQMESVSKTIKPETIASIKEDAKREILLNAKKGPEAIIKSIKSEGKNLASKLAKDTGTFKKGWPNFVKDLVKEGLTKVIPAAALKRRFGSVLGIEQTGVVPTKKVNPKTGKVTNFNKPVYKVPKANDQNLIDYFTGQEKRKTSLLEVLGQDLVVEQMQELMTDQDFMSKLDTATDGKAVEIMESLDQSLDTRQLEDTSLDTVKASRGKEFKPLTPEEFKKQQISIAQTADINEVAKILGYPDVTATKANKEKRKKEVLELIKKGKIGSIVFELTRLEFNARNYKYVNGEKVYEIKSGEYVKKSDPRYKKAEKNGGFVAAGNSLYYSKKDPAYVIAMEAAKKNDAISFNKKLIELNNTRPKIGKVAIPPNGNLDPAWVKRNSAKMKKNQEALQLWIQAMNQAANNGASMETIGLMTGYAYQASTGIIKIGAPFKYAQDPKIFKVGNKAQGISPKLFREEHNPPASTIGGSIWVAIASDNVKGVMSDIKNNFSQAIISKFDDSKIDDAGLAGKLSEGKDISNDPALRYAESGIDLETLKNLETGETMAFEQNVGSDVKNNANIVEAQNDLVAEQNRDENPISAKESKGRILVYGPIAVKESRAGKFNNSNLGDLTNTDLSIKKQIETLSNYDKAATLGRALNTPERGISVFDFDDTLARTKEKVIVNKADGSTIEISAAKFAEQASELQSNGAKFDFSNFENVSKGTQKGPLADLALKRQGKFGSKDIFVLTARPQIAATGIKTFLDGIGLNLPLENITGLEDGSPQAKAGWVVSKAAEGYNDFYFADDAIGNVKAVSKVLDQIDVKSKVQQAKASKGKVFKTVMNDIVQGKTGIDKYKDYSSARAQTVGKGKGTFDMFIPPSAEDFKGLLYKLLGKGKVGDAQFQFFTDNLIDPYNRAENALIEAKMAVARDFKALKNSLKTLPKSLSKLTNVGKFTFSQAVRVAAWTRQGMTIPGLSKRDTKELNDFVAKNPELNTLVDELIKIQKGKPYPKPGKDWLSGNITSDIVNEINTVNRKEYMQEFNENVDLMFDDAMFNKLEAAYGPNYVEALKDSIRRMKSGSNRAQGGGRIVDSMLDWLNNSVGAVMFLNTRSGLLQMLSAVNFINFGNNNLYKAGKAFLNQKQYWGDFMKLINSDYLTERRNGLKINVSESEIADAVKDSKNKPKAAIAYLLSKGFIFTRIADSFAIAAGGSTFYRNQIEAYVKEGMSQKDAETKAFEDFRAVAEETQQSSNPSKISQQQASGIGRVVLAFANTPMQYARIIKRSAQDLINGRGDWRANVSKIVYYSTVQNLIFNALQQALFALAFDEDEDETDEAKQKKLDGKKGRIANGMADSLLRGMGYGGALVSTLKNVLLKIADENKKKSPKYNLAVDELLSFSPPLDSKLRKLKSAANTFSWNGKDMKEEGFNLNNPAYLSVAQVVSSTTNIPLDRAIQKINNLRAVASNSSEKWQKVAMLLGWSTWDVGLPYYGVNDKVEMTPQMILKEKVTTMAKETSTKEQKQLLLDLGLTKQQIKALKYEEIRVKKIIELQEKTKK